MKRISFLVIVIALAACLLLSGCTGLLLSMFGGELVPYEQMEYTRPGMPHLQQVLDESCAVALESSDIKAVENAIWNYYDVYDDFYTNYNLAMISYFRELNDTYWKGEYAYCAENSAQVDAGLDRLYRCLAKSPIRDTLETDAYFGENYFDSFEGESIYDEYLTRLLSQEASLVSEYQTIWGQSADAEYYSEAFFTDYGTRMAAVFLDLVQLRQEIAAYVGYDSYPEFAYDFYYGRDYSVQQATSYLADIRAELSPLYRQMDSSDFQIANIPATESATFQYVQSMASNMGGTINSAFSAMNRANVYDITYSPNKYATSFEVYLSSYSTPYIFLSPSGTNYDKLSFTHEFGHFCTDYVMPGGSLQGIDVAEFFSQGMEYLSLFYADGGTEMENLRLALCLTTYVEQAAYASFEHQVYQLTGEDLTVEGIQNLYQSICTGYGFDESVWDSRDYVCVPHFYEQPLYVISYVLSNDAAFQLYEMEQAEKGTGLRCYEENLASSQYQLLGFLSEAGLTSPFETGRLSQVKQALSKAVQ